MSNNTFIATGRYKGDISTDRGRRVLHLELPAKGNKNKPVPVFVIPDEYKARNSTQPNIFQKETNLLVQGRPYLIQEKGKSPVFYITPISELQSVPKDIQINQISLSGIVYKAELSETHEELLKFDLSTNAPEIPNLFPSKTWMYFHIVQWDKGVKKRKEFLYDKRAVSLSGTLEFTQWQNKEYNQTRSKYQITILKDKWLFQNIFKDNKQETTIEHYNQQSKRELKVYESPHQHAMANIQDDGIPF